MFRSLICVCLLSMCAPVIGDDGSRYQVIKYQLDTVTGELTRIEDEETFGTKPKSFSVVVNDGAQEKEMGITLKTAPVDAITKPAKPAKKRKQGRMKVNLVVGSQSIEWVMIPVSKESDEVKIDIGPAIKSFIEVSISQAIQQEANGVPVSIPTGRQE